MTQADIAKYKALYLQAAGDNVHKLQENSVLLLDGNTTEEVLENMHRESHSLKSESILMGYNNIGQVAAAIENIFEQQKEQKLAFSPELLTLLDETIKKLQVALTQIETNDHELDLSTELQQLQKNVN